MLASLPTPVYPYNAWHLELKIVSVSSTHYIKYGIITSLTLETIFLLRKPQAALAFAVPTTE